MNWIEGNDFFLYTKPFQIEPSRSTLWGTLELEL